MGSFIKVRRAKRLIRRCSKFPEIGELLSRLAVFHYQLSLAAGDGGKAKIGRTRRERYVFTRRNLLTVMKIFNQLSGKEHEKEPADQLPAMKLLERAINMVYLMRIQEGTDRLAVRSALSAAGLKG